MDFLSLNTSAIAATTDKNNNTYIAGNLKSSTFDFGGTTLTFGASTGVWVAKYDHNDNLVWVKQWNSDKAHDSYGDYARGIAVDSDGNVFLSIGVMGGGDRNGGGTDTFDADPGPGTAQISTPSFNQAAALIKLDANGSFEWVKNTGVSGGAGRITVDPENNVYLTGTYRDGASIGGVTMESGGPGTHHFVAKIGSTGNIIWTKTAYANNDVNGINDISIAPNGKVYLAGYNGLELKIDGISYTTNWGQNADHDGLLWVLNQNGSTDYVKKISGTLNERYLNVLPLSDGSVILSGTYQAGTDIDPSPAIYTPPSAGGND